MNQELQNYIKQMHEQGFSDEQIREELKKAGWSEEQIEAEIIDTPNPNEQELPKEVKEGDGQKKGLDKKIIAIIAGAVLLLSAGGAFGALYTDMWNPGWDPFAEKQETTEGVAEQNLNEQAEVAEDNNDKAQNSKKLATIIYEYSKRVDKNDVYFSPSGNHVAYRTSEGDRMNGNFKVFFVLVDEVLKKYDFVSEDMFFLPNEEGIVYIAEEGDKNFLVRGGVEGKKYPKINLWDLYASNDRTRFAYSVVSGDNEFIVVDGEEGRTYDMVKDYSIVFSPDSKKLAYAARENEQEFVVVNGEEHKRYDEVEKIVFSPDNKHMAYSAKKNDKWFMVIDGKEDSKKYDFMTRKVFFTPNSEKLVYMASRGTFFERDSYLIIGDEEMRLDVRIQEGPVFSTDGNTMSYVARYKSNGSDKMSVVFNGEKGKEYYWVWSEPVISPDGNSVAYIVAPERDSSEVFLATNEKEGKRYDGVTESPVFSPDSQKVAYAAIEYIGGTGYYEAFPVVDGNEGERYLDVWNLSFSEDAKHIEYGARIGDELWWIEKEL